MPGSSTPGPARSFSAAQIGRASSIRLRCLPYEVEQGDLKHLCDPAGQGGNRGRIIDKNKTNAGTKASRPERMPGMIAGETFSSQSPTPVNRPAIPISKRGRSSRPLIGSAPHTASGPAHRSGIPMSIYRIRNFVGKLTYFFADSRIKPHQGAAFELDILAFSPKEG